MKTATLPNNTVFLWVGHFFLWQYIKCKLFFLWDWVRWSWGKDWQELTKRFIFSPVEPGTEDTDLGQIQWEAGNIVSALENNPRRSTLHLHTRTVQTLLQRHTRLTHKLTVLLCISICSSSWSNLLSLSESHTSWLAVLK